VGTGVYFHDEQGELVSLPTDWTDMADADPFVVVAAGRSPFGLPICWTWPILLIGLRPRTGRPAPID
jgi:hypothetical protein